MSESARPRPEHPGSAEAVGERIRAARRRQGLTLRTVAERIGISVSALSQIETGKVQPTMRRVYDVVEALDVTLDSLFGSESGAPGIGTHLQRRGDHPVITLEDGVTWERVNPPDDTSTEVLLVRYPPGARTGGGHEFIRHRGRETGFVLAGSLYVELAFDGRTLGQGDSITYDSGAPHRVSNPGTAPAEAMWITYGA